MTDGPVAGLLVGRPPRPRREILFDEGRPLLPGQRRGPLRVLVADLAEDDKLLRGARDELRLPLARQVDRAIRDFDIAAAVPTAELEVILDEVLRHELLEERAAEKIADAMPTEAGRFLLQARRHEDRTPAELDEVYPVGGTGDRVFESGDWNAVIDDDGESVLTRLLATKGHAQRASVHGFSLHR